MKVVQIQLSTTRQVQQFVGALTGLEGDFELQSGQYLLDARSLMGIFGLDLTKPLQLKVYNDSQQNMEAIRPYLVEKEEPSHEQ